MTFQWKPGTKGLSWYLQVRINQFHPCYINQNVSMVFSQLHPNCCYGMSHHLMTLHWTNVNTDILIYQINLTFANFSCRLGSVTYTKKITDVLGNFFSFQICWVVGFIYIHFITTIMLWWMFQHLILAENFFVFTIYSSLSLSYSSELHESKSYSPLTKGVIRLNIL